MGIGSRGEEARRPLWTSLPKTMFVFALFEAYTLNIMLYTCIWHPIEYLYLVRKLSAKKLRILCLIYMFYSLIKLKPTYIFIMRILKDVDDMIIVRGFCFVLIPSDDDLGLKYFNKIL